MHIYQTSQIAKLVGVHPNTVRLYEEWQFISKPTRRANGYRVYTDEHINQIYLLKTALRGEVLQNGLRKRAIQIVKTVAHRKYNEAIKLNESYLGEIATEKGKVKEAIRVVAIMIKDNFIDEKPMSFTRKEAANYLEISIDTLRNWELNGLLTVKRKANGYRIYNEKDIQRLKIIRTLRCANYSLMAILRMLGAFEKNNQVDVEKVIDTPRQTEDIISVCDRLLSSLNELEEDAVQMKHQLLKMKEKFNINLPL